MEDKNFNDAELADIMNEIENLEKNIKEEMDIVAPEKEFVSNVVVPIEKKADIVCGKASETKMDFTVEGDMRLKMNFTVGGENIWIHVSGEEGLVIELASGAKFTIPVAGEMKKAA